MEAQNAESKADFIHKMKIAAKEAEETQYWLMLCDYANNYPDCKALIDKLDEINKVLGKILSTSQRKSPSGFLPGSRGSDLIAYWQFSHLLIFKFSN